MRVLGAVFFFFSKEDVPFLSASLQNEPLLDHSCFLFLLLLLLPQNRIVGIVFGSGRVGDMQVVFHCRIKDAFLY